MLVASDSLEALQIARNRKVDVVISEIMMPQVSGIELLKTLKQIDPMIEVIMMTSMESIQTARQALRLGASDYVPKPFEISAIRVAVTTALAKRRLALARAKHHAEIDSLLTTLHDQLVQEEMTKAQGQIYASVFDNNSPLSVISSYVELLNFSMEPEPHIQADELQSLREHLQTLQSQVSQAREISHRYLNFLHPSASEYERTHMPLKQVLSDLEALLGRHRAGADREIIVENPCQQATLLANGADVLQILLNLSINALQSAPAPNQILIRATELIEPCGEVAIEDSDTERFINREKFSNKAPMVAISVLDRGAGIRPETMKRLFSERVTTKPSAQAAGLGLVIANRLLVSAGLGLHIKTLVGVGTTVTVYLPINKEAVASNS